MKPYVHSLNSARRYGGKPEDYLAIHDFFDSTKATYANIKHRAILHNTFGIFLVEKIFGHTFTNSDGKIVHVRDVGEDHVMEDLGTIPSIEKWLVNMPIEDWMTAKGQATFIKRTSIPLDETVQDNLIELAADGDTSSVRNAPFKDPNKTIYLD